MKTILFIGVNKSGSSREATKAAENLGYLVVLFTNNPRQIEQRELYPDIHNMILIDTTNLEEMKQEIQKLLSIGLDIQNIVSFVDPFVHVAALLCDEFCHNLTSSKAIKMMEDKEETRNFLLNEPYSPKFQIINPQDQFTKKLHFPVIVKSPKSTGSKDVLLANNKKQLNKHISSLRNKYPEESIIVEEFLDGPQYLVEVIVHERQAHIVAIIKQEITKGQRFIITGYGVLATVPPKLQAGLENVLHSIVTNFDIETGALHLELRLTPHGWKLIEINPRISGGAMNKMIEAAFGINLVEQTLKLFLGQKPHLEPTHQKFVYTKYLIVKRKGILQKVTGKLRAAKLPGVYDVYIKPKKGTLLIPPLSMGHRYAYIITQGKSLAEVRRLADRAAKEIKFHMRAT
ncbi:ATP-grasp domain-containing protein [Lysinibacillus sp. LZ02]|uniref:ATP-grasp domain-containing protein n=1 Tax=Lysinibacillus sp. LZ02 TaxID=3420668 RepID=UPI003D35AC2F